VDCRQDQRTTLVVIIGVGTVTVFRQAGTGGYMRVQAGTGGYRRVHAGTGGHMRVQAKRAQLEQVAASTHLFVFVFVLDGSVGPTSPRLAVAI
jgi:hypothetical protein